jgi:hypothetical protein
LDEVRTLLARAVRDERYTPSPVDWRDEVLYFLLPDRFSDGRESTRPLLTRERIGALRQTPSRPDINWRDWASSGRVWQGGTVAGIRGQLDYLRGLGVTALWIGPVFKQRARLDTFHGYGIQDFLDVDPRFGTREDLLDLVEGAHRRGMRIVLDVILNHTGDNWGYVPPGEPVEDLRNEPAFLGLYACRTRFAGRGRHRESARRAQADGFLCAQGSRARCSRNLERAGRLLQVLDRDQRL